MSPFPAPPQPPPWLNERGVANWRHEWPLRLRDQAVSLPIHEPGVTGACTAPYCTGGLTWQLVDDGDVRLVLAGCGHWADLT